MKIAFPIYIITTATLFLAALPLKNAHADCSSPAAIEGAMDYNNTAKEFQFCDGTNWNSMKDTTAASIWLDGGSGKRYYNGGNVGIGTNDPQHRLDILGNFRLQADDESITMTNESNRNEIYFLEGGDADFSIRNMGNVLSILDRPGTGPALFNITQGTDGNGGNIGIGTENPLRRFHLEENGQFANLLMRAGAGSDKDLIFHYGENATAGNQLRFGRYTRAGNWEANPFVIDMDAPGATLYIAESGNIGIGTSSPHSQLQLNNLVDVDPKNMNKILLWEDTGTSKQFGLGISSSQQNYRADNHVFFTAADTALERMRIDTNGKVAIGTDTDGTLTITGAPDIAAANAVGQGGLVIQEATGDTTGYKLRIDVNEMQASANNGIASFGLQPYGGNVSLGWSAPGASNLDMNTGKIYDLANPTSPQDAATKAYVDANSGGADNLGNHTATTTLNMGTQAITSSAGTIRDGSGGWVRTYGNTGWYNGTYGGGFNMTDTTWVRVYGGKWLYSAAGIRADGGGVRTNQICDTAGGNCVAQSALGGGGSSSGAVTGGGTRHSGGDDDDYCTGTWGTGSCDGSGNGRCSSGSTRRNIYSAFLCIKN